MWVGYVISGAIFVAIAIAFVWGWFKLMRTDLQPRRYPGPPGSLRRHRNDLR